MKKTTPPEFLHVELSKRDVCALVCFNQITLWVTRRHSTPRKSRKEIDRYMQHLLFGEKHGIEHLNSLGDRIREWSDTMFPEGEEE